MKKMFINLSDPEIFAAFGGSEYWEQVNAAQAHNIVGEGEEGHDFYYIVSGYVDVTKTLTDQNQTQKHLADLGPGDFFGEGSLLSEKTRGATVTCKTDAVFYELSPDKFKKLVISNPESASGLLLGIVKVLNYRMQMTNTRLIALYDVLRIIAANKGDPVKMIPAIFSELAGAIDHFSIVMFGPDGLPMYQNEKIGEAALNGFMMHIPDYAFKFKQAGSPEYFVDTDAGVYCAARRPDGTLIGILASEFCEEFKDEEIRLFQTIAEQIGGVM